MAEFLEIICNTRETQGGQKDPQTAGRAQTDTPILALQPKFMSRPELRHGELSPLLLTAEKQTLS